MTSRTRNLLLLAMLAVLLLGGGWWLRKRAMKNLHPDVDGIDRLSDTEFLVKQSYLNRMVGNLAAALQTARAAPNMEGGKVRGFRIEEMQETSPFHSLGIEKGDLITGLDDVVFDEVGKGLNAFIGLRGSSECRLKVERNHKPITIHYKVDNTSR